MHLRHHGIHRGERKRVLTAQQRHELHLELATVQIAIEIEQTASSSGTTPPTIGRLPRLATAGQGSRKVPAPRTRTANTPASGTRRRLTGMLAVGKPSLRPS